MTDRNAKNPKTLAKVPTNVFKRGAALLNLTLASSAKLAVLKVGDLFTNPERRQERLGDFLRDQAHKIVEELGNLKGSIMKAGQMLSVYGEHFFPPEVNSILKSLQQESRPVDWDEMARMLRSQLGPELLEQLEIDPTPIAAASMGQVYRAVNKATGDVIALKVQYPGVDKAIDSDLQSLRTILSLSSFVSASEGFDEIFKEIRMMLHYEVDYQRELEQFQAFAAMLADDPRFVVPKVYPEFSTKRVLAMSYEDGVPVDSPAVDALSQERRNDLGAAIMELMFREIFEWGQVQTDPHFGNYRIRLDPSGKDRIVLLDFGAVRKFPRRYIAPFADLVWAAMHHQADVVRTAGIQLGFLQETDSATNVALFYKLCITALEGFQSDAVPYSWGDSNLLSRLTELARDAVFAFRLRSPPREAVFMDRKMIGIYVFISRLRLNIGSRSMLVRYLEGSSRVR